MRQVENTPTEPSAPITARWTQRSRTMTLFCSSRIQKESESMYSILKSVFPETGLIIRVFFLCQYGLVKPIKSAVAIVYTVVNSKIVFAQFLTGAFQHLTRTVLVYAGWAIQHTKQLLQLMQKFFCFFHFRSRWTKHHLQQQAAKHILHMAHHPKWKMSFQHLKALKRWNQSLIQNFHHLLLFY